MYLEKYYVFRKELKKCEFELYEAYCMDVIISTGEGKVWTSSDKERLIQCACAVLA